MTQIRVAINGFGRIGRMVFRALVDNAEFDVCLINDLEPISILAYLLKYDSVHGKLNKEVNYDDNFLYIGEKRVQVFAEKEAKNIPYKEISVDFVIEATGHYTKLEKAKEHLVSGAVSYVMITAPADVPMFVMGVNHAMFDREKDTVFSCASCTTNCLAPIAKVLHDNFGIVEGLMTTIHAVTATQKVVDVAGGRDKRACRTALSNMGPSSTGAAKAVGKVIPELEGKLTGTAFRVPVIDVSVVDLTVRLAKSTSLDDISAAMKKASETNLHKILGYTEEELVSTDFIGCPLSAVYDKTAGIQLNPNFFKLVAWYDNEWGYANRCVDLMRTIMTNC